MANYLTRFAIRVSKGLGSCSAAKLKCINPIPISTTPDATIVQMIRDRVGFSSAAARSQDSEVFSVIVSTSQRPNINLQLHWKCRQTPTMSVERHTSIVILGVVEGIDWNPDSPTNMATSFGYNVIYISPTSQLRSPPSCAVSL